MSSRLDAKRKREAAIKDWRWLLWESGLARDKIHPELGAGWTAVLKEACGVKAGVQKDKVNRLREEGDRGPLQLWRISTYGIPFTGMVVTVPLLEWCVKRKYKPNARTFLATARGGDMDAVRWLREHKVPWDREIGSTGYNACAGAARGGHLDLLKWLREEGCPWDEWTCHRAAEGGHLDVLKYAHENGCPWHEATCFWAARGGHLDVLKYAHENGCPWDAGTCRWAAWAGHLDVVKYMHENGCPWDERTCMEAAGGGHLDVLKYAHENGCPFDADRCRRALRRFKQGRRGGGTGRKGRRE